MCYLSEIAHAFALLQPAQNALTHGAITAKSKMSACSNKLTGRSFNQSTIQVIQVQTGSHSTVILIMRH